MFMSKMGFTFDSTFLTDFELSLLRIIHKEVELIESKKKPEGRDGE